MTVGLTRVDAPGGSILWIAGNGTGSEMSSASRSRLDGPIGVGYPSRTTPTDSTRRDSAVPILSRPGAHVRASTDSPASTPDERRDQLLDELTAYHALPRSYRARLERKLAYAASQRAEERRRRNIRARAAALLVAHHRSEYLTLVARERRAGGAW